MINLEYMQFLGPELALLAAAVIVLAASLFDATKRYTESLALAGVLAALWFLPLSFHVAGTPFPNMLVNDAFSVFFRSVVLAIGFLTILLSRGYRAIGNDEKGEYYFFILTLTASIMLASATRNLMMMYITLEAISLLSYILAGYLKRDAFSAEAGLKYFLFGALSTGITLYGISLVYGLFGTLDLASIGYLLTTDAISQPILFLVLFLVLVGFGFKCSLVPFHMWTPDVYQGAPSPVAAFFSVGPKAVGFAFLLRIFVQTLPPEIMASWALVFAVLAMLSMTIGNIIALQQDNVKRILAYSTIAQAGYILIGLTTGSPDGVKSSLFYILVYSFMNLGAFGVVIAISNAIKAEKVEDYAGLYKKAPFLGIMLAVSFLALAGIPPLAGFMAKFLVFASAIQQGLTALVIVAALNSVIALYYYARVIKFAFLQEPTDTIAVNPSRAVEFGLLLILVVTLLLGVFPQPVLSWLTVLLAV